MKNLEEIKETIKTETDSYGVELVDVDLKGKPGIFRMSIFVDTNSGVTIDQCSEISKRLISLRVLDPFLGEKYHLEVSSPGINRPLEEISDFKRKIGVDLNIKFQNGDKVKKIKGKLIEVTSDAVKVKASRGELLLPFDKITKATQALPW